MDGNGTTIKALASALNFMDLRKNIISSNIANADTPGFKAKRLSFEQALKRAINLDNKQTLLTNHERHFNVGGGGFNNLKPEIFEDPNGVVSKDGNTVDRDDELARLADNKILYDASVQLLNKKLGLMKYALSSER